MSAQFNNRSSTSFKIRFSILKETELFGYDTDYSNVNEVNAPDFPGTSEVPGKSIFAV